MRLTLPIKTGQGSTWEAFSDIAFLIAIGGRMRSGRPWRSSRISSLMLIGDSSTWLSERYMIPAVMKLGGFADGADVGKC
jgi:hypothetical protein